jgi:hypothetical protein
LGASFVDGQRSALEALTVESADGTLRVFTFYQLDKSESAWLAADFVTNHHGRGHTKTGIRHELAERTVSSAMRQIPYIKLSHSILQLKGALRVRPVIVHAIGFLPAALCRTTFTLFKARITISARLGNGQRRHSKFVSQ